MSTAKLSFYERGVNVIALWLDFYPLMRYIFLVITYTTFVEWKSTQLTLNPLQMPQSKLVLSNL
jgi:hypothetical protein